jgi:hypothetical protein
MKSTMTLFRSISISIDLVDSTVVTYSQSPERGAHKPLTLSFRRIPQPLELLDDSVL